MCMELGIHLCFPVARGSSTSRWQVGHISVLLTHGRPSECSVLRSCGQPREIPVSFPRVVHPLIRQTFKAVFGCPSRRFWQALRPTNSPWGLPLRRRRPPHPMGFGPWPRRVKPRPTVGGVYRGLFPFNCLPLPWGQLRMKCPPLPQPQHMGFRLPSTSAGDLLGRSAVDCWRSCLSSAHSSRTKLVVKLVDSSTAAVATCAVVLVGDIDVDTLSSASTCCTVVPGRHVLSAWK